MSEEEGLATIVVPGPVLRDKIDLLAARLSLMDMQTAENAISKLLSSPKRDQVLFLDPSHILYPYFLSKLTELRAKPASEREAEKNAAASSSAAKDGAAAASPAGTSNTTITSVGGITRTVGGTAKLDPKREAALHQAEEEARLYMTDPFPNVYSLDLKDGSVDMPPFIFEVMSVTAQYAAKYGQPFVASIMARQRTNAIFRFLQNDDSRHDTFEKLVESYKRILTFDPEETEARLEQLESRDYVLGTLVAGKSKFAKAAIARRKAALLTDDQLRAKLHWNSFKVVKSFSLSDLSLDGAVPESATSRENERRRQRYLSPATVAASASSEPTALDDISAPSHTIPPPSGSNYLRPPTAPKAARGTPPRPPMAGSAPKPPIAGSGYVRPATTTPTSAASSSAATPAYMSADLVHGTEAPGHKRAREDGGEDGHAAPEASSEVPITENYTPREAAPERHAPEYFVDTATGEQVAVEALQRGGGTFGVAESGPHGGVPKLSRAELGLASEDDLAKEIRRHTEQDNE